MVGMAEVGGMGKGDAIAEPGARRAARFKGNGNDGGAGHVKIFSCAYIAENSCKNRVEENFTQFTPPKIIGMSLIQTRTQNQNKNRSLWHLRSDSVPREHKITRTPTDGMAP